MPYIPKSDRTKYINLIDSVVQKISEEPDLLHRGEHLGYFLDRLRAGLENTLLPEEFNSDIFEFERKTQIELASKKAVDLILQNEDMLKQAGELNYVASAVIWGILGDSLHAPSARYGFRAFVKGAILRVYDRITIEPHSRRTILLQGVFSDIIDEMYRRKTSKYEDEKIKSSGDIWPLRSVGFTEVIPFDNVKDDLVD